MTQEQQFWKSHQKIADRYHAFNWMMQQENKPTKEELKKLREKNPKLWNAYPQ